MASLTQTAKNTASFADSVLKFLFGYIERLFTINIPKQYKWMTSVYYPIAKSWVSHPRLSHPNQGVSAFLKGIVAVVVALPGVILVIILWIWCFIRSLVK